METPSTDFDSLELAPRVVPRNRQIMLRYLEGQSIEQIADYFQLQPATISNILRSPLVQQELVKLQSSIAQKSLERVSNLSDEAIDVVRDTMRGESNSELKLKAAKEILSLNPELQPKKDSGGEFAMGLGESILRAVGKRLAEKAIEASNGEGA